MIIYLNFSVYDTVSKMQILHIPAFDDNYIWLLKEEQALDCCIIDPGDAKPVLERLESLGLNLCSILITHHHYDHIDGVNELLEHFPDCQVYSPDGPRYHFPHHSLADKQVITPQGLETAFTVLALPGHTLDHLAYYGGGCLLAGDILFSAGCGRLTEGSAEQMHQSLQTIAALPPETRVYPSHEYTQSNLQFAIAVEPQNESLKSYLKQVSKLRQQGLPSLPTTLEQELNINPFLRCQKSSIRNALQAHLLRPLDSEIAIFSALRQWKDHF